MMRTSRRSSPRRGGTMLEMLFSAVLMFVILGSLGLVARSTSGLAGADMIATSVRMDAWRALSRIAAAMNAVGGATIDPALAVNGSEHSDTLTFQSLIDVAAVGSAANLSWQPAARVWLDYDEGELNNGVDDDGDGLIDDCRVMLTVGEGTPQERTSVLVSNVMELLEGESADGVDNNGNGLIDERGLCFSREGDVIRVRLTLARRDERGRVFLSTVNSSIRIRN